MVETIYVKLGGSLITDKTRPMTPKPDVIRRLAREIGRAREERPHLHVLLGHGSGSFGHVLAREYRVRAGVHDARGWEGYARTAAAAARLNRLVADLFLEAGVPVVSLPPSASARCRDGVLISLETHAPRTLLQQGLVPLVYGDVSLDDVRGGTIVSTEEVFVFLAQQPVPLRPTRILLVGEVPGVFTADPRRDPTARLISHLSAQRVPALKGLGGSHGVDVTGGMASKVQVMADLVRTLPEIRVHILSGAKENNVYQALLDPDPPFGTHIVSIQVGISGGTQDARPRNAR